ncbi:hypothetical protein MMC08_002463 [Hypocenomyce scalaris]|nr:hypothetical protein [Hypocenomyce scalaris]
MQAIKDLISGKTADTPDSPDVTQSGREPASGQTGAGTTSEPYDAGNTTGDSSIGGAAPSESTYGSSNTNTGSAFGGSTLGSDSSNTGGVENTFGRDRGGPQPGNQGPHQISIANKLDPKVDSDGDGKSKSGPSDIEHATVPGRSSTADLPADTPHTQVLRAARPTTTAILATPPARLQASHQVAGIARLPKQAIPMMFSPTAAPAPTTTILPPAAHIALPLLPVPDDVFANDNTSAGNNPSSTIGGSTATINGGQGRLSRSTGVKVTGGNRTEHRTNKTGVNNHAQMHLDSTTG